MKIELHDNNRGYVLTIENCIRKNGEYSYINTEEEKLLEDIGELIFGYKVKVERR